MSEQAGENSVKKVEYVSVEGNRILNPEQPNRNPEESNNRSEGESNPNEIHSVSFRCSHSY